MACVCREVSGFLECSLIRYDTGCALGYTEAWFVESEQVMPL